MKNQKSILVLGTLLLAVFLSGCGTMGQQTTGGTGAVQATSVPSSGTVIYVDYPSPAHDNLKSIFQQTVKPGSTVQVYNNAGLTSLIGQQTANYLGMFIIDLGDNVAANDTVYLVVTESGKQPSPAIAFTR